MDFVCPVCHQKILYELRAINSHTEQHIIDAIKKKYPEWSEKDGVCPKCHAYYDAQRHQ